MRIKSVPLLFVDAVGTLVPTNADDRNANAIFIICVTRVVVSNISGVRAVVLCLLLSLSAKKKSENFIGGSRLLSAIIISDFYILFFYAHITFSLSLSLSFYYFALF